MSELTDLRDALEKLTHAITSGGSSPSPQVDKRDLEEKKKSVGTLGNFNRLLSVFTGGIVAVGLQNTVEGKRLEQSMGMFAYSMAELARGPVRLLTQAFTALAAQVLQLSKLTTATPALNVMHQQEANEDNVQTLYNKRYAQAERGIRMHDEARANKGLEEMYTGRMQATDRELIKQYQAGIDQLQALRRNIKDQPAHDIGKTTYDAVKAKKEADDHLKPIYQTTFSGLTSLWESLQSKVTENPALELQKKGNTILEMIYNILATATGNEKIAPHDLFGGT